MKEIFSRAGPTIGFVGLGAGLLIALLDWKDVPVPSWLFWLLFIPSAVLVVAGIIAFAWPFARVFRLFRVTIERVERGVSQPSLPDDSPILSIAPLSLDGFVHIRVENPGEPDTFVAQVIDFSSVEEPQTQYSVKWRETPNAEKFVIKDDLLDLAQIVDPVDKEHSTSVKLILGDLGENVGRPWFERGEFRLFSAAKPDGWRVHAIDSSFDPIGTIPPEERALTVFDACIRLRLRVTGARGQTRASWIRLGFQRPDWSYDHKFWVHKLPVAEIEEARFGIGI